MRDPDRVDEGEMIERVIEVLCEASGVLRCRRGDRLVALYCRGMASVEVSPRAGMLGGCSPGIASGNGQSWGGSQPCAPRAAHIRRSGPGGSLTRVGGCAAASRVGGGGSVTG